MFAGVVFVASGMTPWAAVWAACVAPRLIGAACHTATLWAATCATYVLHGLLVEALPGAPLQPATPPLARRAIAWRVTRNLASTAVLSAVRLPLHPTGPRAAACYLIAAVVGNELVYAPVHRLLHAPRLYRLHRVHHAQRAPRALGAAYCGLVEMWVANVASVALPLYLVGAPAGVMLVWLLSAVQTTQLHHASKTLPWTVRHHQPAYHDAHHAYLRKHYGNLGWFERWLA